MDTAKEAPRTYGWLIPLGVLLLVAGFLRLQGLGDLGLWIDEDLTWIASHSIIENGQPVLPSGEVYSRGVTYSYAVAAFLESFGSSLFMLRLPSILFSLLGIVLVAVFARHVAGTAAGLLAATVLAFSPWDFHYAQMARMYSLFGALFIATVFFIYRAAFTQSRGFAFAAFAATMLAIPTHQLGSALIWVYLVPFFFTERKPPWTLAFGGFVTLATTTWGFKTLRRFLREANNSDIKSILEFGDEPKTLEIPFIPSSITLNHSEFIAGNLWSASTLIGGIVALGLFAILGTFLLRRIREKQHPIAVLCALAFVSLLALNQFVLASLAALFLLNSARRGEPCAAVERSFWGGMGRLIFEIAATMAGVLLLLLLGRLLTAGMDGLLERRFLRLFVALPVPFYRLLVFQFPIMSIVVFVGGALAFLRGLRPGADSARSFTFLTFVSLLVLMGMFLSPYVINRYNFYLNGLFVTLFAIFATDLIRFLLAHLSMPMFQGSTEPAISRHEPDQRETRSKMSKTRLIGLGLTGLLLVFACEQFDPKQTWAATQRGYGYNRDTLSDPDLISHFRYDYRSAAEFILKVKREQDAVAAKEPVEVYPYGVRCDYRINKVYGVFGKSKDGSIVDWYLDIPFVTTLEELEGAVADTKARGGDFWIVFPRTVDGGPAVHLDEELKAYLSAQEPVFETVDGVTVVLKL